MFVECPSVRILFFSCNWTELLWVSGGAPQGEAPGAALEGARRSFPTVTSRERVRVHSP